MVFRKPYGFLIKNFRLIHLIISGILICYIAIGIIMTLSPEGDILTIKESIENSYLAVKLYDKNIQIYNGSNPCGIFKKS